MDAFARHWVRSYRTFPPLLETAYTASGGLFLLHFSSDRSGRALPVILALWSPDFPHPLPFGMRPRLSDPVVKTLYPIGNELSNTLQILFGYCRYTEALSAASASRTSSGTVFHSPFL